MFLKDFSDRRSRKFLLVRFDELFLVFDRGTDNDTPDAVSHASVNTNPAGEGREEGDSPLKERLLSGRLTENELNNSSNSSASEASVRIKRSRRDAGKQLTM